jgi:hypothetical protein
MIAFAIAQALPHAMGTVSVGLPKNVITLMPRLSKYAQPLLTGSACAGASLV